LVVNLTEEDNNKAGEEVADARCEERQTERESRIASGVDIVRGVVWCSVGRVRCGEVDFVDAYVAGGPIKTVRSGSNERHAI
jgi:hypothetical protein